MSDSDYLVPYIKVKGQYLAIKQWKKTYTKQSTNLYNQEGGFTFKEGNFVILCSDEEVNARLQLEATRLNKSVSDVKKDINFDQDCRIMLRSAKCFPSVKNTRNFLGVDSFRIKMGDDTARELNSSSVLLNLIKFFMKKGEKILKQFFEQVADNVNKTCMAGAPYNKEEMINKLKAFINSPRSRDHKLSFLLPSWSADSLKDTAKFNQLVQQLTIAAKEINETQNAKINKVYFVKINRLGLNELLGKADLDTGAINTNIKQEIMSAVNVTSTIPIGNPSDIASAVAVAEVDQTGGAARTDGFFQFTLDKQVGGTVKDDAILLFNNMLSLAALVLAKLFCITYLTVQKATPHVLSALASAKTTANSIANRAEQAKPNILTKRIASVAKKVGNTIDARRQSLSKLVQPAQPVLAGGRAHKYMHVNDWQ